MRFGCLIAALLVLVACAPAPRPLSLAAEPHACANDYQTVETVMGRIMDIKPAPEPFPTADIDMTGPAPCGRMWMQVLKTDAAHCHVGDAVEATGVVTEDVENNSWQIGPTQNDYMTFAQDFTCGS